MDNLVTEIQSIANSLYNSRIPQFPPPVQRVRSSTASSNNGTRFLRKHSGRESGLNANFAHRDLINDLRGRSASISSSLNFRSSREQKTSFTDLSFSMDGLGKNCIIPELPESPYLTSSTSHSYCSVPSSQDSSNTCPLAEMSTQAPSPPSPQWLLPRQQDYCSLVTSTPNMQYCGIAPADNFYTLPSKRNVAREYTYSSDNIAEENSFVVRRSSLTGQLEQFQKPFDKNNARPGFKVLNRGVRNSLRRRSSKLDQNIVLPGVETTV